MNKKGVVVCFVLILCLSLVSAGWWGDFWDRVSGDEVELSPSTSTFDIFGDPETLPSEDGGDVGGIESFDIPGGEECVDYDGNFGDSQILIKSYTRVDGSDQEIDYCRSNSNEVRESECTPSGREYFGYDCSDYDIDGEELICRNDHCGQACESDNDCDLGSCDVANQICEYECVNNNHCEGEGEFCRKNLCRTCDDIREELRCESLDEIKCKPIDLERCVPGFEHYCRSEKYSECVEYAENCFIRGEDYFGKCREGYVCDTSANTGLDGCFLGECSSNFEGGSPQCVPGNNSKKRVCESGGAGVGRVWVEEDCEEGNICINGLCTGTPECDLGQCFIGDKKCHEYKNNVVWKCDVPEGENCGEWVSESCEGDEFCSGGACISGQIEEGDCSTTCDPEDILCVTEGSKAFFYCRYNSEAECYEWRDVGVCEKEGFVCENNECKFPSIELETGDEDCVDYDGGMNVFFASKVVYGGDEYIDVCITQDKINFLKEYYCLRDNVEPYKFECPNGCVDGACVLPEGSAGAYCNPVTSGGSVIQPKTRVMRSGDLHYCDPLSLQYKVTKDLGVDCVGNYECQSNVCLDGKCVSVTALLEEQTGFLQRILCYLKSMFSSENYERCIRAEQNGGGKEIPDLGNGGDGPIGG
ncbi:hypothetical protein ACFL0X_02660 [Nanoarchaeota archaeon]